jgi:geranylgeranyl diphosphate synthase, type I
MLRGAGLDADAAARAATPWEAMRTEVLGGQYLDVFVQSTGDSSARAALQIDRYKTAAYTVERPLHLGAAIAGAGPDLVACYRRFGADIGVAFQLRDDLLGVFGDPAVTGKPAGDDLREGKRTLLLALAIERAEQRGSTAAVAEIEEAVGDPELDDARLDRVRDLLDDLGAVQAVEQRIAALTGSALDALGAGSVAEPAASRLADLAVAATRRHR